MDIFIDFLTELIPGLLIELMLCWQTARARTTQGGPYAGHTTVPILQWKLP